MTIAPVNFAPQQAYSDFDFTPLMQLAKRQQQPDQTLASLESRYGLPPTGAAPTGAAPAGAAVPSGDTDQYGRAISSIESGGRYDRLGPVTKTGDRAYGKYQRSEEHTS